MTKSEKQSWEQQRAKGYNRFLLRSILFSGLPFGVVVTLAGLLVPIFTHRLISPIWQLAPKVAFYAVGFGAIIGAVTWRRNEQVYEEPTEDDDLG